MRILDLYIGRSFLYYVALICSVLLILFSLFELLSQLDDVGKGNYHMTDAIAFVAMTLPKRLLDILPVCTLLGGIIALGLMADRGEIVAMEASGVPVLRICGAVFATGMLLMLLSAMLAELVVPGMEQYARKARAQAMSETSITLTQQGFWARMDNTYIHVDKMLHRGIAADIDLFEFDGKGNMLSYTHAGKAQITDNSKWILSDVTQKIINDTGISTRKGTALTLDFFLSANQVSVLELPPFTLSTSDLLNYIDALEISGQNAEQYSVALWRKLTVPLTTGAMVLLSLSFVFGSTRTISASYRITSGTLVGIVLYFFDQISMQWGLLLELNPIIIASIPALLISCIALIKLRKIR